MKTFWIGRLLCGIDFGDPGDRLWWYHSDVGDLHTSYLSVKRLERPGEDVPITVFEVGPFYLSFALAPNG